MYGTRSNVELGKRELDAARLGFKQLLRCKRFSSHFIDTNADDLFGTATLEYSRKLAEGEEIENPPGWLIICAWRRTKSQLEAEGRNPSFVSTEKTGPLVDEGSPSPEDALLNEDRFRKVREAVGDLSVSQRRILMLSYFEGFTVREAGRRLHWHSSRAQRAHEGAKRRLHELLGVESSDELAIAGLAAYLSLAGRRFPLIHDLLARGAQKSAEGYASFKQQASTAYSRVVDPTPFAGARPGTVIGIGVSCLAIGSGAAKYCVEQGVNPVGAARSLIASSSSAEAPSSEPSSEAEGPIYTPAEPTVSEEPPPPTEAPEPQPEEAPQPKKESAPPPPDDSIEPVRPSYMAAETESTQSSESPEEAAPVESSSPAPVAAGAGPQFGGP